MKVLILGCSSIALRRVLPALENLAQVTMVDIASHRPLPPEVGAFRKFRAGFTDYGAALHGSDADLVYVSLHNSAHQAWIDAALDAGKHVVADKPAFLDAAPAAASLARARV